MTGEENITGYVCDEKGKMTPLFCLAPMSRNYSFVEYSNVNNILSTIRSRHPTTAELCHNKSVVLQGHAIVFN